MIEKKIFVSNNLSYTFQHISYLDRKSNVDLNVKVVISLELKIMWGKSNGKVNIEK